jgi:hypothetical protein
LDVGLLNALSQRENPSLLWHAAVALLRLSRRPTDRNTLGERLEALSQSPVEPARAEEEESSDSEDSAMQEWLLERDDSDDDWGETEEEEGSDSVVSSVSTHQEARSTVDDDGSVDVSFGDAPYAASADSGARFSVRVRLPGSGRGDLVQVWLDSQEGAHPWECLEVSERDLVEALLHAGTGESSNLVRVRSIHASQDACTELAATCLLRGECPRADMFRCSAEAVGGEFSRLCIERRSPVEVERQVRVILEAISLLLRLRSATAVLSLSPHQLRRRATAVDDVWWVGPTMRCFAAAVGSVVRRYVGETLECLATARVAREHREWGGCLRQGGMTLAALEAWFNRLQVQCERLGTLMNEAAPDVWALVSGRPVGVAACGMEPALRVKRVLDECFHQLSFASEASDAMEREDAVDEEASVADELLGSVQADREAGILAFASECVCELEKCQTASDAPRPNTEACLVGAAAPLCQEDALGALPSWRSVIGTVWRSVLLSYLNKLSLWCTQGVIPCLAPDEITPSAPSRPWGETFVVPALLAPPKAADESSPSFDTLARAKKEISLFPEAPDASLAFQRVPQIHPADVRVISKLLPPDLEGSDLASDRTAGSRTTWVMWSESGTVNGDVDMSLVPRCFLAHSCFLTVLATGQLVSILSREYMRHLEHSELFRDLASTTTRLNLSEGLTLPQAVNSALSRMGPVSVSPDDALARERTRAAVAASDPFRAAVIACIARTAARRDLASSLPITTHWLMGHGTLLPAHELFKVAVARPLFGAYTTGMSALTRLVVENLGLREHVGLASAIMLGERPYMLSGFVSSLCRVWCTWAHQSVLDWDVVRRLVTQGDVEKLAAEAQRREAEPPTPLPRASAPLTDALVESVLQHSSEKQASSDMGLGGMPPSVAEELQAILGSSPTSTAHRIDAASIAAGLHVECTDLTGADSAVVSRCAFVVTQQPPWPVEVLFPLGVRELYSRIFQLKLSSLIAASRAVQDHTAARAKEAALHHLACFVSPELAEHARSSLATDWESLLEKAAPSDSESVVGSIQTSTLTAGSSASLDNVVRSAGVLMGLFPRILHRMSLARYRVVQVTSRLDAFLAHMTGSHRLRELVDAIEGGRLLPDLLSIHSRLVQQIADDVLVSGPTTEIARERLSFVVSRCHSLLDSHSRVWKALSQSMLDAALAFPSRAIDRRRMLRRHHFSGVARPEEAEQDEDEGPEDVDSSPPTQRLTECRASIRRAVRAFASAESEAQQLEQLLQSTCRMLSAARRALASDTNVGGTTMSSSGGGESGGMAAHLLALERAIGGLG